MNACRLHSKFIAYLLIYLLTYQALKPTSGSGLPQKFSSPLAIERHRPPGLLSSFFKRITPRCIGLSIVPPHIRGQISF
uniref:Putative secreted peptide n=1 Tax=Anopheles braziliensis TaxID=58242 RepID=A0A2M3ZQ05_9DIPT